MIRATTSRYTLRFYLVIFFGVLYLDIPLAYAQTVPLGEYTCLAPDEERGGASGIAFAEEVRAIIVFVRFKDDDWGDCGKWWCEMESSR